MSGQEAKRHPNPGVEFGFAYEALTNEIDDHPFYLISSICVMPYARDLIEWMDTLLQIACAIAGNVQAFNRTRRHSRCPTSGVLKPSERQICICNFVRLSG